MYTHVYHVCKYFLQKNDLRNDIITELAGLYGWCTEEEVYNEDNPGPYMLQEYLIEMTDLRFVKISKIGV